MVPAGVVGQDHLLRHGGAVGQDQHGGAALVGQDQNGGADCFW